MMAYVYLLDLYKHIEKRMEDARHGLQQADGDVPDSKFEQGRIDILTEFRDFLKDNFNPKLPRRIRKAYFDHKN